MSYTLLLSIFLLISSSYSIEEDDNVLVLTTENFDSFISSNPFVFVEFYAPWCGHCKALAPEYTKAAQKLKEEDSPVKLAKVDGTVESELINRFQVGGFPTMKFFRNQTPIEYLGGRTSNDIIQWITKKMGSPITYIENHDDAKSFIDKHEVALIAFFSNKDSENVKSIEEVAQSFDDHHFSLITSKDVMDQLSVKDNSFVLYKKFDELTVVYTGDYSLESLKDFVTSNELPMVVEFNAEVSSKVFGSNVKTHLVVFLSPSDAEHQNRISILTDIAKFYKGKIHTVYVNVDIPDHTRILEFFGLTKENVPVYRLINLKDDMVKYKPDVDNFEFEHIKSFVLAGLEGKLKPLLLSQDVPSDWDSKPVKVLVDAPWCGHCKKLAPIWDELAETYQNSDVIIAKVDATANEIEGIKIANFPTIKYFPRNSEEIIDYDGDRTLTAFKDFLDKNENLLNGEQPRDEL